MFRVGQKVVCIDASPAWGAHFCDLFEGAIYTVTRTGVTNPWDAEKLPCIEIAEDRGPHAYWAHRFRPVVEKKTDISIFTAMLNPSKRRIEA